MQSKQAILVINSGSSSLKFAIIQPTDAATLLSGLAERVGSDSATLSYRWRHEEAKTTISLPNADHRGILQAVLTVINDLPEGLDTLAGIGHRVVHGGEDFAESVVIDSDVLDRIDSCSQLAPLHNPANLMGIRALQTSCPELPQVAVFDTAFHQSLPPRSYVYPLPRKFYREHGLRRYGFHGTSHRYVAGKTAEILQIPKKSLNIITLHLGNGCSACAIKNGVSIDTSMGLTPLEGLVMGTRSGDLDPGLILHLQRSLNLSIDAVDDLLNKQSGLLGLSGSSNDMRSLLEKEAAGDKDAALAIEVFCYKLAKTIAAYFVACSPVQAVVFTGGIGENAAVIRSRTVRQLGFLGLTLDNAQNEQHGKNSEGFIDDRSTQQTRPEHVPATENPIPRVMVVPTNEELLIAQDTLELLQQR